LISKNTLTRREQLNASTATHGHPSRGVAVGFPPMSKASMMTSSEKLKRRGQRQRTPAVTSLLGAKKKKCKSKRDILAATVAWVVEENQPFNATVEGTFCRMTWTVDDRKAAVLFRNTDVRPERRS
jgi:hypothetical protein